MRGGLRVCRLFDLTMRWPSCPHAPIRTPFFCGVCLPFIPKSVLPTQPQAWFRLLSLLYFERPPFVGLAWCLKALELVAFRPDFAFSSTFPSFFFPFRDRPVEPPQLCSSLATPLPRVFFVRAKSFLSFRVAVWGAVFSGATPPLKIFSHVDSCLFFCPSVLFTIFFPSCFFSMTAAIWVDPRPLSFPFLP